MRRPTPFSGDSNEEVAAGLARQDGPGAFAKVAAMSTGDAGKTRPRCVKVSWTFVSASWQVCAEVGDRAHRRR